MSRQLWHTCDWGSSLIIIISHGSIHTVQVYERLPLQKEPGTPNAGSAGASPEVQELMELYPEVDSATLGNVYNAAGKDVEVTKKVCCCQVTFPERGLVGAKACVAAQNEHVDVNEDGFKASRCPLADVRQCVVWKSAGSGQRRFLGWSGIFRRLGPLKGL